ncbi:Protein argonaute 18 [Purpureocillium lavendulum]|uniref:Protein argonaute 18 n=1 Tax=Purpureocillium lavendulum TaxID=1247861 RepID=A0AB34FSC7_9HYPO|nr:Protein argonaute 18 [Purpureocillium lavendulum]
MISLLDLPREIRDQILREVILSQRKPPVSLADCGNRVPLPNQYDEVWPDITSIYIEDGPLRFPKDALLGTCRQLRSETEQLLALIGPEKLPYTLDVMLVDQVGIFPTWLTFPAMPTRIELVRVRVRLFGKPDDFDREWEECVDDDDELTYWNLIALFTVYILSMWKRNDLEPVDETTGAATGDDWSDVSSQGAPEGTFSETAPYVIDKIQLELPGFGTTVGFSVHPLTLQQRRRLMNDEIFKREQQPAVRFSDSFVILGNPAEEEYDPYRQALFANVGSIAVSGGNTFSITKMFLEYHAENHMHGATSDPRSGFELIQTINRGKRRRQELGLWNDEGCEEYSQFVKDLSTWEEMLSAHLS